MVIDRKLCDSEAKELLARWPAQPHKGGWFGGHHFTERWLRTQPKTGKASSPRLFRLTGTPEHSKRTQPDGMWINVHPDDRGVTSTSVFVIEVCTSTQNLSDKRTRYRTGHAPLHIELPMRWLREPVHPSRRATRSSVLGLPENEIDWPETLPVVNLKVLYAVPGGLRDSQYLKVRDGYAWESHEAVCPHRSLDYTRGETRDLVERLLTPPWPVTQVA